METKNCLYQQQIYPFRILIQQNVLILSPLEMTIVTHYIAVRLMKAAPTIYGEFIAAKKTMNFTALSTLKRVKYQLVRISVVLTSIFKMTLV